MTSGTITKSLIAAAALGAAALAAVLLLSDEGSSPSVDRSGERAFVDAGVPTPPTEFEFELESSEPGRLSYGFTGDDPAAPDDLHSYYQAEMSERGWGLVEAVDELSLSSLIFERTDTRLRISMEQLGELDWTADLRLCPPAPNEECSQE